MKTIIKQILVSAIFLSFGSTVATAAQAPDLALQGGKVYSSPTASPIDNAVVLIRNGRITAVGKRGEVKVPKSVRVIDCTGKVLVAGFWNSHVHFETGWQDAATASANKLEAHMQEMLTQWGFTTVWDLGSEPGNTLALRRRVEAGEVPAPSRRNATA
jgi:predicted amidohydrolase YtcJ